MRYTSTINNLKCIEWELTLSEAFLMDILIISEMWAKRETLEGIDYRWVSRGKVLEEIPHAYKTSDRVYRSFKALADKGVIDYRKLGKKDLVRVTEKGKEWVFSEAGFDKRLVGKKAEKGTDSILKPSKFDFKAEKGTENSVLKPTYNGVEFNHGVEVNNTLVSDSDLLVEFWNDNRPSTAAVKKGVWSKVIKTRLKTFSADEIKTAMLTVINSQWHQQNSQVLIKNAIDSDKRCAEAIEKSSQTNQLTVNNQGNNNEGYSTANSQPSQQNHFDKLRAEAAAKYGNAPTDTNELRTVN